MKFVSAVCPSCGAHLTIDQEKSQAFCQFCGEKLIIDDENTTVNINQRFVDEARIKEADVRLKELEYQRELAQSEAQDKGLWTKCLIGFLVTVAVLFAAGLESVGAYILLFGGIALVITRPKQKVPGAGMPGNPGNNFGPGAYGNNPMQGTYRGTPGQGVYRGNPGPEAYRYAPQEYGGYYPYSNKNRWIAFFLCLFLGPFGVHYFYVGKVGMGLLYFFTFGLFGFGYLVDIIRTVTGHFTDKYGRRVM